jgi:hypothetical protein
MDTSSCRGTYLSTGTTLTLPPVIGLRSVAWQDGFGSRFVQEALISSRNLCGGTNEIAGTLSVDRKWSVMGTQPDRSPTEQ